jgi:type II secretory pathway pseudopilin PulG
MNKPYRGNALGFSLLEIAIVLIILTILLSAVAIPLSSQIDAQRVAQTNRQLESIRDALIGFAISNGRLPCPATDGSQYGTTNSNGQENRGAGGACAVKLGYVPAAALGLAPQDAQGFAVDAWGATPNNRMLYGVSQIASLGGTPSCPAAIANVLTADAGIKTASIPCVAGRDMLLVCSTAPNSAPPFTACPATGVVLTKKAPFVLISRGKNSANAPAANSHEQHNIDSDETFVSHTPTSAGAPGGEFDDLVLWSSIDSVIYRMVEAKVLP